MKSRCYNSSGKDFIYYGGRGIFVCDEWRISSGVFIEWALANGYTSELTLDRIDPNGNYEPGNCRFVTWNEQKRNRRPYKHRVNHQLPAGVIPRRKRFRARRWDGYKVKDLGCYDTPQEAHEAFLAAKPRGLP